MTQDAPKEVGSVENDNVLRVVDSAFILYTEAVEEKQLIELIEMDPEKMKDFHPLPKA